MCGECFDIRHEVNYFYKYIIMLHHSCAEKCLKNGKLEQKN